MVHLHFGDLDEFMLMIGYFVKNLFAKSINFKQICLLGLLVKIAAWRCANATFEYLSSDIDRYF